MEKRPKSFVLYHDFEEALLKLSIRERGILFTMIYSYANRGSVDTFLKSTTATDMAFAIIRAQLDRDMEKYDEKCKKNAENGRLGGRPHKENENRTVSLKTERFFEKPKKPYNNTNTNNNNNNSINNNNYSMRSFDSNEFFAAALARTYGEKEKEKNKEKEKEDAEENQESSPSLSV